jgi:Tfp pilus assembly protein PilX
MRTILKKLETSRRIARPSRRATHRRGVILIAVLVIFSVSLTLFGLWSRAVIREHRSAATQQFRIQASRLAEAGLERAVILRATNAKYDQEVWSVPAAQLDATHTAQVRIRVAPTSDARAIRYEATAEFPAGTLQRAQITKSIEIPNSVPMNKS